MGGTFSSSEMSLSGRKLGVNGRSKNSTSSKIPDPWDFQNVTVWGVHACVTYQATISLAHFITQKSLWPSSFTAIQLLFTYQKNMSKNTWEIPGPQRGPAAALGHLQVDELPSLPWRGRRARSTRRAWSNKRGVEKVTTNEFLIAQWVILSWNPWVGRMARQPVELTRCVFSRVRIWRRETYNVTSSVCHPKWIKQVLFGRRGYNFNDIATHISS